MKGFCTARCRSAWLIFLGYWSVQAESIGSRGRQTAETPRFGERSYVSIQVRCSTTPVADYTTLPLRVLLLQALLLALL